VNFITLVYNYIKTVEIYLDFAASKWY